MNRFLALAASFALMASSAQADDPTSKQVRTVSKGAPMKAVSPANRPLRGNGDASRVVKAGATGSGVKRNQVVPAGHQGAAIEPVPMEHDPLPMSGSMGGAGCSSCGGAGGCDGSCGGNCGGSCGGGCWDAGAGDFACCDSCFQPSRLVLCFPQNVWVQADYLMWWGDPMPLPRLVNTNPLPGNVLLGEGNNDGNDTFINDRRAGGRLRFGWKLGRFENLGIQAEYLGLGNARDNFTFLGPAGTAGLFYTGFNGVAAGRNDLLIHSPIRFDARSQLDGGGVHFRRNLYCGTTCEPSRFGCESVSTRHRIDLLLGYRYMQLKEELTGNYNGQIGDPANNFFTIQDNFRTLSQFNGVDFGFNWQAQRGYWSLDGLMRLAMGNVREVVRIDGTSTWMNSARQVLGGPINSGFYASSNIGAYTQNNFAVIPELGATLGYQLTQRVKLNFGYTFIYWSNVVRPGDQIDTDINVNNVPILNAGRPAQGTAPNRPQFNFVETDYWVQGLNFGAEMRW